MYPQLASARKVRLVFVVFIVLDFVCLEVSQAKNVDLESHYGFSLCTGLHPPCLFRQFALFAREHETIRAFSSVRYVRKK